MAAGLCRAHGLLLSLFLLIIISDSRWSDCWAGCRGEIKDLKGWLHFSWSNVVLFSLFNTRCVCVPVCANIVEYSGLYTLLLVCWGRICESGKNVVICLWASYLVVISTSKETLCVFVCCSVSHWSSGGCSSCWLHNRPQWHATWRSEWLWSFNPKTQKPPKAAESEMCKRQDKATCARSKRSSLLNRSFSLHDISWLCKINNFCCYWLYLKLVWHFAAKWVILTKAGNIPPAQSHCDI